MQILSSSLQLVAFKSHGSFSRVLKVASKITATGQHRTIWLLSLLGVFSRHFPTDRPKLDDSNAEKRIGRTCVL
jgi:hypothetical protein